MLTPQRQLFPRAADISSFLPQRLGFSTISWTSQSDLFPADSLSSGGDSSGWVSQELSTYPQELLLDFAWPCILNAVYVVCHRYFVPTIVDVHTAPGTEYYADRNVSNVFVPIAQIHFDPVDAAQQGWRHKRVTFHPAVQIGRLLKITCRYYHHNPNNIYGQVGLTCIEFNGQKTTPLPQQYATAGALIPFAAARATKEPMQWSDNGANRDDVYELPTSSTRVQPKMPKDAVRSARDEVDVQQLLCRLESYKQAAVNVEDFRKAGCIKVVTDELAKIALEVEHLEEQKQSAIDEENFLVAETLKYDILKLTVNAMNLLKEHHFGNVFERGQLKQVEEALRKREMLIEPAGQRTAAERDTNILSRQKEFLSDKGHEVPRPTSNSSVRRSTFIRSREREISANRKGSDQPFAQAVKKPERAPNTKITEHAGDVQYALAAFGEDIVNKAPSTAFKDRVLVVDAINTALDRIIVAGPSDSQPIPALTVIRGAIVLLDIMIKEDPAIVQLIVQTVLKMLQQVLPGVPEAKEELMSVLNMALAFSFARLGSTNRRIPQILMPFVVQMATMNHAKAQNIVMKMCCEALKPASQARYSLNRMRIIQDLALNSLDLPESCLTLEMLLRFAISAMDHHDREVRRVGEKLIIHLYSRTPPASFQSLLHGSERTTAYRDHVRSFLPPPPTDADRAKRNFKYRRLYQVLAEIDVGDCRNIARLESPLVLPFQTPCKTPEKHAKAQEMMTTSSIRLPKFVKKVIFRKQLAAKRDLSPISDTSDVSTKHLNVSDTSRDRSTFIHPSQRSSTTLLSTRSVSEQSRLHATKSAATSDTDFATGNEATESAPDTMPSAPKNEDMVEKPDISEELDKEEHLIQKTVPLLQNGKYWKYLQLIADAFQNDGYSLAQKDQSFGHRKNNSNVVSTCPFCGKPGVMEEFNWHLYQECPMLKLCNFCDKKVLVSELNDHWLEKCQKKLSMTPCPRCGLAIATKHLKGHTKNGDCLDVSLDGSMVTCPLCRQCVQDNDEGWITHLLGEENGCRKNKRRAKALKWTRMNVE